MRIGLTYDLRAEYLAAGYGEEETAEFDRPDTIDALENALRGLGYETDRIGTAKRLIERLGHGDRWDLVFNIAEGLHGGAARESQVPAILDVYDIPYTFSDPVVMGICLHKGLTKLVVRDAGVPTPDFALVHRPEDIPAICLPFPVFAKPVAEGTGKGVGPTSKIRDPEALDRVCRSLLEQFRQPVLVETFLPGREFTVGLLGTGPAATVLGTLEIVLLQAAEPDAYSYVNKEKCEELVEYRPVWASKDEEVRRAEEAALDAWRALGCRDGGRIDLRSDGAGQPNFIECNPLAGLHPFHSDLPMIATAVGMPYQTLIGRIVDSARAGSGSCACILSLVVSLVVSSDKAYDKVGCVPSALTPSLGTVQIAILHNRVASDASASDRDVLVQVAAVTAALDGLGHRSVGVECDLDLLSLQRRLRDLQPDAVFNLVESLDGSDSLMFLVPALLDRMNVPYTGAPTEAIWLTNHKLLAKERMSQAGLPTPVWRSDTRTSGSFPATDRAAQMFGAGLPTSFGAGLPTSPKPPTEGLPDDLRRPAFTLASGRTAGSIQPGARFVIKAVSEHASVGLDEHSLVTVTDEADLQRHLGEFRKALQRPCFAEQFIDGREFNISLLAHADGCQVLSPAEIDFSAFPPGKPRLVGYRAKWEEDTFEYQNTPRRFDFPPQDATLLQQIGELSQACWDLFAVRGYTRVDFRVDQDGQPWILEVNANPCLSPDAGFAAALARAGIGYEEAIARILSDALGT